MGTQPPPQFRPMSIVVKRPDGSRWHLAWRWALVQATLYRRCPSFRERGIAASMGVARICRRGVRPYPSSPTLSFLPLPLHASLASDKIRLWLIVTQIVNNLTNASR